jgi:hypothetical protein
MMANRKIVAMMIGTIPAYSISRNKNQGPTQCKGVCGPRNPRFKDVQTGTKRCLEGKTNNQISGISGSAPTRVLDDYFFRHTAKNDIGRAVIK